MHHRSNSLKLLCLLLCLACGVRPASAQYVLGSPNSTLNPAGWALDSSNLTGFSSAITNPAYFGTGGTVSTSVTIDNMSTINAGTLAGVNGFIAPWIANADAASYLSAVTTAFRGGMDLWVLEDDSAHNPFGASLLNSSVFSPADGTTSSGSAPFFSGPFGTATGTATYGNFAQFNVSAILASGGTIAGYNASGQATVAYWARGAFAPGSGALILFSDVDMISNWEQNPYSPTLNANGILALNTVAWLTQGARAVPEPNTYVLLGLGGLAVVALARRRVPVRPDARREPPTGNQPEA